MRLLVVVLLSFGLACGSDGADTAAPPPSDGACATSGLVARPPAGADRPALLVAEGAEVALVQGEDRRVLGRVDGRATLALAGAAGEVVVEVTGRGADEPGSLVRLGAGCVSPVDTPEADSVQLADVSPDGRVLYATFRSPIDDEPSGDLVLQSLADASRTVLGPASAPEYGVHRVSIGGDVAVVSADSDLTETFIYLDLQGGDVPGRANPTEGLAYNQPPRMAHAVLAPDGSRLAYLEGPDWDPARFDATGSDEEAVVGNWQLVVVEAATGDERLRVELGGKDIAVDWLDFDGRWAVASVSADGEARPAMLVDTTVDDPAPVAVELAVGIASIVDAEGA